MADTNVPLSLVVRVLDEATGPLKAINEQIAKANAPARAFGKELTKFGEVSGLTKLGSAFSNVGSKLVGVKDEVFSLGAKLATMGAAAGFALYTIAKGALDAGTDLEAAANRTGLSVDAYAQLRFAASQAHVSQDEFTAALDQFNKRLGELRANKGPLKELGESFGEQLKHAKGAAGAFDVVTAAVQKIHDPAKRAAFQNILFGKSSREMANFLGQGSAAIKTQMQRYMDLAGSQEEFAKNSAELERTTNETEAAFLGLRNAATGALFPALTDIAKVVTGFFAGNRDGIKQWAQDTSKAIQEWVRGGGMDRLIQGLKDIGSTVRDVFDAVGGLSGTMKLFALYMGAPLIGSVLSLGVSFVRLGVAAVGAWATLAPLVVTGGAITIAFVAAGAAIYQVVKNWEALKASGLSDVGHWIGSGFGTIDMDMGGVAGFKGTPQQSLRAGPPAGGATASAPPVAQRMTSDAAVTVNFSNMPKGIRVDKDPGGSAPVDLNLGYSMGGS